MNSRGIHRWEERLEAAEAVCAGVLSGTSADGIDVALARFSRRDELTLEETLAFETIPFEPELGARVRAALDGEALDLRGVALLSRDLGRAFGRAAREVASAGAHSLDLVGSHGQTVYHHDGEEASGAATLQLGDGDFVAAEAGVPCAFDFRQADLAAGGEGAPLSPLADRFLFRSAPRPLLLLNLGGFANLTWIGENGEERAFDTGPANVWLDALSREHLDRPFDANGEFAARGQVHGGLLDALLAEPFFDRSPPKSTGRDTLGPACFERCLASLGESVRPEDQMRTAVAAVARSVAQACQRWIPDCPGRVHACGGGVHHAGLMAALATELGREVTTTQELGVDPGAREGLVFALLGAACASGVPVSRAAATGAREGEILGKLCFGSGGR